MYSPSGLKCSDVMNSLLVFKGGLTDKNKEFNDRVFDCVNKKIITFDNFKEVFNICSSIGKECTDPGLLEILIAELIPFKFEQYQIVRASTLDSSMESYKRIYLTNLLKLFIKMVKKYQFEKETFADFSIIELHQREYSNGNTDCRILIRGKAEDYKGRNTCLSLSLETLRIITVYKNCGTDNHSTLDGNNYRNISVKEILEKLIK